MAQGTQAPGMGIAKHRKSGNAGRSPKFRHAAKREAEKAERKAKPPLPYKSVSDAFGGGS